MQQVSSAVSSQRCQLRCTRRPGLQMIGRSTCDVMHATLVYLHPYASHKAWERCRLPP